jgi:hypothetical protein
MFCLNDYYFLAPSDAFFGKSSLDSFSQSEQNNKNDSYLHFSSSVYLK